ncbi:MAG: ComEA family DNA-binding protein [Acidimicrobiia bacterium]|nr:ComEA family DNA-binding protein [Acidimicrobiia bacterium]
MLRAHSNLQVTVVGLAVVAVVGSLIWFGLPTASVPDNDEPVAIEPSNLEERVTAHVSGAVGDAGLVDLPAGSRIADAVAAAGGATAAADLGALNLAAAVRDGDHIVVPVRGAASAGGLTDDGKIDLNRATAQALQALPGVGPVLAQRIVDHRQVHGPFDSVEDLLDVAGIGEAKLASMRDAIASP